MRNENLIDRPALEVAVVKAIPNVGLQDLIAIAEAMGVAMPFQAVPKANALTMARITEVHAAIHRVSSKDLRGTSRSRVLAHARQDAWREIRERMGRSYPEIAAYFKRDHTTVLYGVRKSRERAAQ